MPVPKTIQRPSTCYSSVRAPGMNHNAVNQRSAWMAFHKQRTPHVNDQVATPMSWPGCMRPAAGLGTLEASQRKISTAQPTTRTADHGTHLPPLNNTDQHRHTEGDFGRGCRHKSKITSGKKENSEFSARKWANQRPTQIHANNLTKIETEKSIDNLQFKRAFPVPRQKRREKVVSLSEREAASLRRLRGIYDNTKEKTLRAERIKTTMKSLQDKTLHTEVDESLHEYQRKVEVDKGNRKELKRVRERYFKDKKRRTQHSHISLNALESPQVSRHAYGLPEEGKEFEENHLVQKTEQRLQQIWRKAVRRAIVIDKMINYNINNMEPEVSLPKIKIKRNSIPKKSNRHEESPDGKSNPMHISSELINIDVAMTEIDALSSVGSDFDDDDLTDIGEED